MAKGASSPKATRIVAVGGGKGGVGKSVVSSNLAVALAQAGQRVVIIDVDLGAANLHTMFGVLRPEASLVDFITRKADNLSDVAIDTDVPNLRLIPGAGAVPGVANINHAQKQRLLRNIRELEADTVIVDVGAGTSYNVVDLFDVADIRLVVITPQVPSLVNAYAFLKAAVYRVIARLLKQSGLKDLLEGGLSSEETERVSDIVKRVQRHDPAAAARIQAALDNFGARIVGNQLYVDRDLRQVNAISRMAKDFLCLDAPLVTYLWRSQPIEDSIRRRKPYMISGGSDGNVPALRRLAEVVLLEDVEALRRGREWSEEALQPLTAEHLAVAKQSDIENYVQRADRFPVDWPATLDGAGGQQQVRIKDVSMDGALVEGQCSLGRGSQATLHFDSLVGRPQMAVEVRNIQEEDFGLQFVGGGSAEIVAFAQAESARNSVGDS